MRINRRVLIGAALAAAAAPRMVLAQSAGQRLVAIMIGIGGPDDADGQERVVALRQGLRQQGWIDGENVHLELRYTQGNLALSLAYADELAAMHPDVFICSTTRNAVVAHAAAPATPLVFVEVLQTVNAGLVDAIVHPGGNVTGMTDIELSVTRKMLTLLLEIAPQVSEVGVIYNPNAYTNAWEVSRAYFLNAAAALRVQPTNIVVSSADEIDSQIDAFASRPNTGLLVPYDEWSPRYRASLLEAVNRNRLPAIYPSIDFARDGGLVTYAADMEQSFTFAGSYAGLILNGTDPADLPIRLSQRYILLINLRTAAAHGVDIPTQLLATADRIIQ